MKISILCPWEIPVPLNGGYGGIERIAQDLAEEAHRQGHDVTIYCTPSPGAPDWYKPYAWDWTGQLGGSGSDIVLDMTHEKRAAGLYHPKWKGYIAYAFLTDKLSGINDVFATRAVAEGYGQPKGKVIYPGVEDHYKRRPLGEPGAYLLFLGRISKHKRPDIAIQLGRMTGTQVIVAGHVGKWSLDPDPAYSDYIRMQCDNKNSFLVENPNEEAKVELLAHAKALIVPSQWSMIGSKESFGIVAVEGLMSGIPVITSGEGGLGEIVTAETGFICTSLDEYLAAVRHIDMVDRNACLERGRYFRVDRMLSDMIAYWKECQ